jgi:hypothetical protein
MPHSTHIAMLEMLPRVVALRNSMFLVADVEGVDIVRMPIPKISVLGLLGIPSPHRPQALKVGLVTGV